MYKIKDLAEMAGISTRTLRYYDSISLLSPACKNSSSYRMYTDKEVDKLQQIMFYKDLGFKLNEIKNIVNDDKFDFSNALISHKSDLKMEQERISKLLITIEKTIKNLKGEILMTDQEKFIGLKEKYIADNENKHGKEVRSSYGDYAFDEANDKIRKMSKWEFNRANELSKDILIQLDIAFNEGKTSSPNAIKLCEMHEEWIKLYWTTYSKDSHLALARMYYEDERFTAYYDKVNKGSTVFLYECLKNYLN